MKTASRSVRKTSALAILGGPAAVTLPAKDLFTWPIVTGADERAVLAVLRRGAMSDSDVTLKFEAAWAQWHGSRYALSFCNGTSAIQAALWACGVGAGREVIAPTLAYWASSLPALSLGATINFADVLPGTLCIDPADIEHRISRYTRAIVVVHNHGYPCDMREILAIARRRKLKVIEDVSHAHGGEYRGKMLGTLGDVGCFSMMSGKAFPTGEAGMLVTDNRGLWERAVAFGHYERTGRSNYAKTAAVLTDPSLIEFAGLPQGGCKHRINQLCSAMGLTQLARYPRRMAEIQEAMNLFWDLLEGVPGVRAHRPAKSSGSTMGGWYAPVGLYVSEELGGMPIARFAEAVRAEGCPVYGFSEFPLHLHPLLQKADIYGHGKPTVLANAHRDVRQGPGSLPIAEGIRSRVFSIPWFKHHRPRQIRQYSQAIRKVCENWKLL